MFQTFLQTIFSRTNMAHAAFLGGIAWFAWGSDLVGQSFEINGLGALLGGLALIGYAYLLGNE